MAETTSGRGCGDDDVWEWAVRSYVGAFLEEEERSSNNYTQMSIKYLYKLISMLFMYIFYN